MIIITNSEGKNIGGIKCRMDFPEVIMPHEKLLVKLEKEI